MMSVSTTLSITANTLRILSFNWGRDNWTMYVKDVGMLLSEELERGRKDPANKFWLAQWDQGVR